MTGKDLFDSTLDLIGLRTDNGDYSSDTADLSQRALSLINILLAENSWLDYRIRRKEPDIIRIQDLDTVIDMAPLILYSVLPYGMAALMLNGEDDALAAEMNRHYTEAQKEVLKFGRGRAEAITEVYK